MADPGSVLLVDEIENGLHHSVLDELWFMIAEAAKENGCQIIATTHSYEAIKALVKGVDKSSSQKDFSFIRLDKIGDSVNTCVYDYEDMDEAFYAGLEVR